MDDQLRYRQMCQKLLDTLTIDEMNAIMVQLKIDRRTRQSVEKGSDFIDVLEMREFISVGDFHRLIPLLKDHELDQIAVLLEEYMADYRKEIETRETGAVLSKKTSVETEIINTDHSINTEDEAVSAIKTSDYCEEHNAPQEVICMSCYRKSCFACAYMYHKDHEVVSVHELSVKVQDEVVRLQSVLGTLENDKKVLDNEIEVMEGKIQSPIEYKLETVLKDTAEIIHTKKQRCTDSVNEVTQLGQTYLEQITDVLSAVEKDLFLTEEKIGAKLYPDAFTQLCELNRREREMKDNELNINKIVQQLKDGSMEISIRPTSISANIARLTHGCVLGAVMVNSEQMVVIRSQSTPSKLTLTCTSCSGSEIFFWEHVFQCEKSPYPFVLGNTLHISPRKVQILVGCGSKVMIFKVDETKDILFFVKMTSTTIDIPKDSYITGMSPITGKMQDKGVIICDKNSDILQILDNNFKVTHRVKYQGDFQLITCVSRNDVYKSAVASFNSQSVHLLKLNPNDETPRKVAELTIQNSKLHPQSLFFDGTFFTVLWVSDEETYIDGQDWKVVAYKDDGEEFNVCKEGTCDPNVRAVSISHVKNDTLLCFSNGTIDIFYTYKI